MSWSEPLAIAERIGARLALPLWRRSADACAPGGVLLLDAEALSAASLAHVVALVVVGAPADATGAGVAALRATVEAAGAAPVLATFATTVDANGAALERPLVVASRPGEERVGALLAAGPHALALDPHVEPVGVDAEPARVCVVSFEVAGMTGGGIGTASTSLAESLARAGHEMTLLFTGWQEADAGEHNERWRAHYAERGVRLAFVRRPGTSTVKSPHFPARSAYEVYAWLRREQPFDVVHLPENMGHGAYAQLAKRHGPQFAATTFVIGTHGPTRWAAEANRVALTREEFLVNEALEHISVAYADVLLGPSRYLHDYMRTRGWQLPERVHVQPYATPSAVRDAPGAAPAGLPDELVFFGRLETRKGVALLCDALDLLAEDAGASSFEVTFLGPIAQVLGQPADEYIGARAVRWPWRWRLLSDRDQAGAAEYLRRPGVLAVMPSLVDNAPNTVSEAVALGIPLVAGRAGGTGELVAAEQRDDHTFDPVPGGRLPPPPLDGAAPAADPRPLAELLRRRLTTPVEAARPPVNPVAVDAAYDRWHRAVRAAARRAQAPPVVAPLPALSVCLLFDGDDELLAAQLGALAGTDAEVVVADLRKQAGDEVAVHGAPVVRPAAAGHGGAVRAAAVAATHGELVAFVPPGDVPLEGFANALRRAAAATGADVYGCAVLDELDGSQPDEPLVQAFVPLPGAPLTGLTHPAFAAGPYAIRRAALERIGGFAADARSDEADHELLNRAAARGLRLEVIAEPLAAKRRRDRWTTFRTVWPHVAVEPPYDAEQTLRVLRPLAASGAQQTDLLGLLHGARGDAARLERELHDQHAAYEARSREQQQWIEDLEREAAGRRAEHAAFTAEVQQLRRQVDEMSQSAAQLAVRTAREAGRKLMRRARG